MTGSDAAFSIRRAGFLLWLLLFAAGLLLCGREVSAAVVESLTLCTQVLLPALFPFFVLSGWLAASGSAAALAPLLQRPMGKLFHLSGACAPALLLGLVGGYPVGTNAAVQLYRAGQCSREDALSLLRFCNNAGPAFLISALGCGMLGDPRAGALLYGAQVLSALLIGVLFRRKSSAVKPDCITAESQPAFSLSALLETVRSAFAAFQNVCAFVLFFSVMKRLLFQLPLLRQGGLPSALLSGLLEVTGGLSSLAALPLPWQLLLPCCAFLAGFGGLSVTLQSASLLLEAGLPCRDHVVFKLLQGALAAGIAFLLARL